MFDLLRFATALLPLAAYTNVLGLLRLRASPTVLNGAMDFLLLGMAMVGLIAIGPIELFFPRAAYSLLGGWVWFVLLALYFFVVLLIALNLPPKIIVYGLDADDLKKAVCQILEEQQLQSDWLGDMLEIPILGIRAHIEQAGRASVSQIQSTGNKQQLNGWFELERMLVKKTSSMRTNQHRNGVIWLITSFALFGMAALFISTDLPRLKQAVSMLFGSD
ncbi:MAG: hypothetical protein ABL921_14825 [Pirellula sp.]